MKRRGLTQLVAASLAASLAPAAALAQPTPALLQITIERIAPGGLTEYGAIEEQLAATCVRLKCPNSYLALESVGEPKEVWWFVAYSSQADVERVAQAYSQNEPLLAALRELNARKSDLATTTESYVTKHRPEASNTAPWRIGLVPFAVLTATAASGNGAVFEAPDGVRVAAIAAATRADADAAAARLGSPARVFAVRAEWSKPDDAWIAASPPLWRKP